MDEQLVVPEEKDSVTAVEEQVDFAFLAMGDLFENRVVCGAALVFADYLSLLEHLDSVDADGHSARWHLPGCKVTPCAG